MVNGDGGNGGGDGNGSDNVNGGGGVRAGNCSGGCDGLSTMNLDSSEKIWLELWNSRTSLKT